MAVLEVAKGYEPWLCTGKGMAATGEFPGAEFTGKIPVRHPSGMDTKAGKTLSFRISPRSGVYPVLYLRGKRWKIELF